MRTRDSATRGAIRWQVFLAAYFQMMSWVPLGRWNDQPCCPTGLVQLHRGTLSAADVLGVAAFLLPVLLFWYASTRRWRVMMWLALAGYAVWLALQLTTWWPPYLFGASAHWSAVYARAFSNSTQVLPRWENHLPPDGMHVVLQVLLVGVLGSGIAAMRSARAPGPAQTRSNDHG